MKNLTCQFGQSGGIGWCNLSSRSYALEAAAASLWHFTFILLLLCSSKPFFAWELGGLPPKN